MSFVEMVDKVASLLGKQGRISYRALKQEFGLDEAALEALKEELIFSRRVALDEGGRVLVWTAYPGSGPLYDDSPAEGETQAPAIYATAHIAEPDLAAEQAAIASCEAADGERKTITALFADLGGSTALVEGLDPEDARAMVDPALTLMMDAVHQYGGYVAQALGDGIFALFGAPIAYEDHPQRALYAALRMREEIRRYSRQSLIKDRIQLQMRVGINTGEVVVRSIRRDNLHSDYMPVGYSTNLAARMEQQASPGSIVVSEYTHKLTEGYFKIKSLGAAAIEGVGKPLKIYEVLGTGALRTRFQIVARRGLIRFVGRRSELNKMQEAWVRAQAGYGQIFGVIGEPGIGKSRLLHEFKHRSQKGCLILETFSVSHDNAFPYLPLLELIKLYFQLNPKDDEAICKEKIVRKIRALDSSLEDIIPYILWMLGIENRTSSIRHMDPGVRRQRQFEAVKRLFLREGRNQPLLLVFEDLHWFDSGTLDFLDGLCADLAAASVMLLVTFRPEYHQNWGKKTPYTQIRLSPLDAAEAEELLTCLLGTDKSLSLIKPILLDKIEGNPLFLEEVVQTLSEEGVLVGERGDYRLKTTPMEMHISPTIQGVLAARVDRLGSEEKDLLQQLSVIGRHFPFGLVKQIITWSEDQLHRLLSSLQTKEFLYAQAAFPEVHYHFKHALTHDLAYRTVLQNRRKDLHERTARALEAHYSHNVKEHYGELAHHYSHSAITEKAVMYLGLAGQQAAQHSAYSDAIRYLNQAIDLLHGLPDTPERKQQQITFQITLAASLGTTKGFGSTDFEQALLSARALCAHAEQSPHLSPVLYALRKMYLTRGDLQNAEGLADHHLRLAQQLESPMVQMLAHHARATISSAKGEFLRAQTHLKEALRLYNPDQHHALASLYGDDPGLLSSCYNTLILWSLGYPDQALAKIQEANRLADALNHPISVAWTGLFASLLHKYRRESAMTLTRAEAVLKLSQEHGLPMFVGVVMITRGWSCAEQNDPKTGIAQIHEGLAVYQAAGARFWHPYFLGILSEAYWNSREPEEGLLLVDQALAEVQKNHERQHEAELHRLRGELRLSVLDKKLDAGKKKSAPSRSQRIAEQEAEADFQQAIAIARQQNAKSWELRAATSLARLWRQQNKLSEAYALLSPVYDWFTEGFDTGDLKHARTLLDELENAGEKEK